jgi:hypothetical protein
VRFPTTGQFEVDTRVNSSIWQASPTRNHIKRVDQSLTQLIALQFPKGLQDRRKQNRFLRQVSQKILPLRDHLIQNRPEIKTIYLNIESQTEINEKIALIRADKKPLFKGALI